MDQLLPLGRSINKVVQPTFKAFLPLLHANADAIRSTPKETFHYGPHARHMLDVYRPSAEENKTSSSPILLFLYGGGLVRGEKSLPFSNGLVYANVGHFFAERLGYTVVVPDYRLIEHGAQFPSGGQDVELQVGWISLNLAGHGSTPRDLFIMGNSAGGVHVSTFLLGPAFCDARQKAVESKGDGRVVLRGAILLSVPFHFEQADPSRSDVLTTYFNHEISTNCPLGLLKAARLQAGGVDILPHVKILVLKGELDPEDEILQPIADFTREWESIDSVESREALTTDVMQGHNHISPPMGLGTGDAKAEAWGYRVGTFIDFVRQSKS